MLDIQDQSVRFTIHTMSLEIRTTVDSTTQNPRLEIQINGKHVGWAVRPFGECAYRIERVDGAITYGGPGQRGNHLSTVEDVAAKAAELRSRRMIHTALRYLPTADELESFRQDQEFYRNREDARGRLAISAFKGNQADRKADARARLRKRVETLAKERSGAALQRKERVYRRRVSMMPLQPDAHYHGLISAVEINP